MSAKREKVEDAFVQNALAADDIQTIEQKFTLLSLEFISKRKELMSGIPKFWKTCLANNARLAEKFEAEDKDILDYLVDFDVEKADCIEILEYFPEFNTADEGLPPPTYTYTMSFADNPFFENSNLRKKIFHDEETSNLSCIETTEIRWKNRNNE
eukprot:Pgem_evm1s10992